MAAPRVPSSMAVVLQALLAYVQLAALLRILDIKWPSALGGLFKFFSWLMNTAPQVQSYQTVQKGRSTYCELALTYLVMLACLAKAGMSAYYKASFAYLAAGCPIGLHATPKLP